MSLIANLVAIAQDLPCGRRVNNPVLITLKLTDNSYVWHTDLFEFASGVMLNNLTKTGDGKEYKTFLHLSIITVSNYSYILTSCSSWEKLEEAVSWSFNGTSLSLSIKPYCPILRKKLTK